MPLENKDLFSAEFKEVGDAIRHFSTTRSALTTFLLTVGAAAFGAYFHKQQTSPFFIVAGFTVLTAAVAVCFRFSYLTERYRKYQRELWDAAQRTDFAAYTPGGVRDYHPPFRDVWVKVRKDGMNWALVAVVGILGVGFVTAVVWREGSAGLPMAVCVVLVALTGASVVLVWLRQQGPAFNVYLVLGIVWVLSVATLVVTAIYYKPGP